MMPSPPLPRCKSAAAAPPEPPSVGGILLVDKPAGITSHGVVGRLRRWLKLNKVGHCGTLDPFATGVLVICVNQATRIADHLLTQDKRYRFTVRFGIQTDTLDLTGEEIERYHGPPLAEQRLRDRLPDFCGTLQQQVPRYAAIKVQGKRLYAYARQGEDVERPVREVTIHRLELLQYRWPYAVLEALTSKGTYIRQLAADIGQVLGCGAHLSELTRLASGPFTLEQATALEEFKGLRQDHGWRQRLIPIREALSHLPQAVVEEESMVRGLRHGHLPVDWEQRQRNRHPHIAGPVRLVAGDGQLLGLWWPMPEKGQRRLRIFKPLQ